MEYLLENPSTQMIHSHSQLIQTRLNTCGVCVIKSLDAANVCVHTKIFFILIVEFSPHIVKYEYRGYIFIRWFPLGFHHKSI